MAVALPSDLVVDVMRNADPARRNAAVARLQSIGPQEASEFTGMVDGCSGLGAQQTESTAQNDVLPVRLTASPGAEKGVSDKGVALRGFERLVLRSLFETLLPQEGSGAFGSGPSAGIWRSMAADQFAGVYAKSGGIGIAKLLDAAPPQVQARPVQWPYFGVTKISDFAG